jgi:signal transduction histidine kinase
MQVRSQVFANVLSNAAQAIDGTGSITITTGQEQEDVVIRVADTGSGIKPEHLERIFDPGFTTKGVRVGTGLGLSITYRIIENHQGSIHVESQPGRGTTFTLRLPITSPPTVPIQSFRPGAIGEGERWPTVFSLRDLNRATLARQML